MTLGDIISFIFMVVLNPYLLDKLFSFRFSC
jgi:hypothetical protein